MVDDLDLDALLAEAAATRQRVLDAGSAARMDYEAKAAVAAQMKAENEETLKRVAKQRALGVVAPVAKGR
jgi:hypothetical protein